MSDVKTVVPVNVAAYRAIRLETPLDWPAIAVLAEQAGARAEGWKVVRQRGTDVSVFRIIGKTRKRYDVRVGDWLIILGTSGAMRVCSDRQFKHDYKEIDA